MENPSLYCHSQRGLGYNYNVFWRWIVQATLHSVLIFWITLLTMYTGVNNQHGYSEGYLEIGNTIYTAVVITTCIKAGLEKETWTSLCILQIFGSIVLWFLFIWAFSYFWLVPWMPARNANMLNMAFILVTNSGFWISTSVASSVCIATDIVCKVLEASRKIPRCSKQ